MKAIDAGYYSTLLLKDDGTVMTLEKYVGEARIHWVPEGLGGVTAIANGRLLKAALVPLAPAPEITFDGATAVGATTASFSGTVSGDEAQTSFRFEVVAKIDGGVPAQLSPQQTLAASAETHSVSGTVSGLLPHTQYWARLTGVRSGGATSSSYVDFTTENTSPTAGDSAAVVDHGTTTLVTLPFAIADADGDPVTVQSISTSEGAPFTLGAVEGNTVSITAAVLETLRTGTILFTVSDGFGGFAEGSIEVTVRLTKPETNVLAASGELAPGAGESGSGIPAGATWRRFGVPAITESGAQVFVAGMNTGGKGAAAFRKSVVLGSGGEFRAIVSSGDPVPYGIWGSFSAFLDPAAVTSASGRVHVLFTALVKGLNGRTYKTLWLWTEGGADGASLPTLDLIVVGRADFSHHFGEVPHLGSFSSAALGANGEVFYVGTPPHAPGQPPPAKNSILGVRTIDGSHRVLLRHGARVIGSDGRQRIISKIKTLAAAKGSQGQGRFLAAETQELVARLSFTDGTSGVATVHADTGVVKMLLESGAQLKDGHTAAAFGIPSINAGGSVAAAVTLGDAGAGAAKSVALVGSLGDASAERSYARTGDPAAGADGALFSTFLDPVFNDQGSMAFIGTVTGAGVTRATNEGVWLSSLSEEGELVQQLIAREGAETTGIEGGRFTKFTSLALPDGENARPIFVAKFTLAADDKQNAKKTAAVTAAGLWAADSLGELRLIVREGAEVSGKTVRRFTALDIVRGSPGHARAYNSHGQLIYRAAFTDGTEAIVKVLLP